MKRVFAVAEVVVVLALTSPAGFPWLPTVFFLP
jgi:hypothetical protein